MGRRKSGRLGASADAAGMARASVAWGDEEWRGLWVASTVKDSDDSEDWDEAETVPIRGLSARRSSANWRKLGMVDEERLVWCASA
jgi:hypothetical protein